jgi:hypothetical protein
MWSSKLGGCDIGAHADRLLVRPGFHQKDHRVGQVVDVQKLAAGDGDDGRKFRYIERDLDMALGTEFVDFIRVNCFEHPPQSGPISQIT